MSTMMRILIVILGSFGCCWVNAQSQDHQPAPMMTQPYAEKKKQEKENEADQPIRDFRSLYEEKGKPRFVIFFNREFSDQISEWRTDEIKRKVYKDYWDKPYQTGPEYTLRRDEQGEERHISLNEKQSFDIEQGFVEELLDHGLRLVERKIILRYVEKKFRESPYELKPYDVQKLELEALNEYADVLVEVLYTVDNGSLNILVTATDVKDMSLLAKFNADNKEEQKTWVAGPNGYSQIENSRITSDYEIVAGENGYSIQGIERKILVTKGKDSASYLLNKLSKVW